MIEQLTIFVENKAGRMAEIAQMIADAGVDIRALSLAHRRGRNRFPRCLSLFPHVRTCGPPFIY